MRSPRRQRGVALIVALLAVALALVLVGALLDRGELGVARTRNVLRGAQAVAYAEGLESFASNVLMRDLEADGARDARNDMWAIPMPPQDVPGGRISATMVDLNGCFNLNNLASRTHAALWRKRFENLLRTLELDPALAGAVVDWVDADTSVDARGGAEDNAYLAQAIPYRTANRAFAHVSELRLVRGIDGGVYGRLAPEVCVLPVDSPINLNTATTAVITSIDSRITAALAERIRSEGQANWPDANTALAELEQQGVQVSPADRPGLGVASHYFLARGDIVLDGIPFSFTSLLERDRGVRVLARSRGVEIPPMTATR